MKIQLRYIGANKPFGMIIEVETQDVKRLLDSGDYERLIKISSGEKKEVKDGDSRRTIKRFQ